MARCRKHDELMRIIVGPFGHPMFHCVKCEMERRLKESIARDNGRWAHD